MNINGIFLGIYAYIDWYYDTSDIKVCKLIIALILTPSFIGFIFQCFRMRNYFINYIFCNTINYFTLNLLTNRYNLFLISWDELKVVCINEKLKDFKNIDKKYSLLNTKSLITIKNLFETSIILFGYAYTIELFFIKIFSGSDNGIINIKYNINFYNKKQYNIDTNLIFNKFKFNRYDDSEYILDENQYQIETNCYKHLMGRYYYKKDPINNSIFYICEEKLEKNLEVLKLKKNGNGLFYPIYHKDYKTFMDKFKKVYIVNNNGNFCLTTDYIVSYYDKKINNIIYRMDLIIEINEDWEEIILLL